MLVDITDEPEAKEAGFKIPVCLTRSVYEHVLVPEKLEGCQDYKGRLWDTVYMATLAFRQKKDKLVLFKVIYQMETGPQEVEMWLVFNAHEGFTIMLPSDY